MRIRKHDYCTGVQSKMCSFITQHMPQMSQVLMERAIGILTAGMSTRAVARELNVYFSTIRRLKKLYYARYRVCDVTRTTSVAIHNCSGNRTPPVMRLSLPPSQPYWSSLCEGDVLHCVRQMVVTRYWLVFGPPDFPFYNGHFTLSWGHDSDKMSYMCGLHSTHILNIQNILFNDRKVLSNIGVTQTVCFFVQPQDVSQFT